MKSKIAVIICLILCASALFGCSRTKTGSGYEWALQDTGDVYGKVFGDNEIISVNVDISEEDWKDICDNAASEEYHSADVTVNGVKLENVGFRTKGFSSLTSVANSTSDRYGFKIKTDKYVKGQTLEGLDMFVLNGSFSDASYMREYLTYAACEHLGMITPFLSYADLSLNGEPFGFYIMIEAYDDSFVKRNTDDENAVLYKASSEKCTLGANDGCEGFDVDVGEDITRENVKNLISVLNGTTEENKSELEAIFDVDSALKAWAVNTVLGNYDSYSGSKAHNYYLLWADGKFTYIGWDYNMSVGGFSEDNGASVTADVKNPLYNVQSGSRPLIEKLLAVGEYYERYIGYVKDLCGYFSDIENTVNLISDKISDHVKNDKTAFYTFEEYQENITKSGTDLSSRTGNGPGMQNGGTFPGAQGRPGRQGGQGDQKRPGSDTEQGGQTMPEQGQFPGQDGQTMPEQGQFPGQDGQTMPEQGQFPGQDGQTPPEHGQFPGQGGQTPPEQGQFPGQDGQTPPEQGQFPGQGGQTPPEQGQLPEQGEGDRPSLPDGFNGRFGGGGMMSGKTCSVVDYILQRIENINKQLDGE